MQCIETLSVDCPNCGEPHLLTLDCTADTEPFTEDCSVCCRPMIVQVEYPGNRLPEVQVRSEQE